VISWRVALSLFVLGLALTSAPARAADSITVASEGLAFQMCTQKLSASQAMFPGANPPQFKCEKTAGQRQYKCIRAETGVSGLCPGTPPVEYMFNWPAGTDCPNGPNAGSTDGCAPSQQECLAKPALGPTFTAGSMTPTACVAGCMFDAGPGGACMSTASGSACTVTGAKPTGAGCSTGNVPITNKNQQCTPSGDVCIKPNGDHCMAASSGRQICWTPGETGTKDDGPVKQKRDAGTTPIAPNLQLPSGDNLQTKGPPIQTTTTTNNTTITTVTQNYQTQNGTNAGGASKGESSTGDGTGKEGDGDGDGTASGGQNCEAAPVMTGDPVVAMVATQAWATRCAVEAGNAANVTGDIGNCSQPFTVQGTNANAHQLRAMRAQICPQGEQPDPSQYSGEAGDPSGMFGEGHEIGADGLDMSGLGFGQSCPSIPTVSVMGRTIAFDTSVFCDWMQLGGVFVRIVAALWCLRVIGGA